MKSVCKPDREHYFSQFESAIDTIEAYLDGMPGLTPKQIDAAIATARRGLIEFRADLESSIEKCLAKVEPTRRRRSRVKGARPKGGAR